MQESGGAFDLLFCPAELAGITADQNRHQFDIVIPDIEQTHRSSYYAWR